MQDKILYNLIELEILGQTREAELSKLIEYGANEQLLNTTNDEGETLLMIAVSSNNIFAVKSLLEFGANPNLLDNKGNSVLHHLAITMKLPNEIQREILNILIEAVSKPILTKVNFHEENWHQLAIDSLNQDAIINFKNLMFADETKPNKPFLEAWRETFFKCAVEELAIDEIYNNLITDKYNNDFNDNLELFGNFIVENL